MPTSSSPDTVTPPSRAATFPPPTQFSSLSIKDLLDAREAYHVHLSSIESVVGTAIGRYRIDQDDWYAENPPDRPRPPNAPIPRRPRTFENSVVRPWSWPCLLVLVDRWLPRHAGRPEIPRRLYLADGRVVPTCVVLAPPDEQPAPAAAPLTPASELLGGGYPCLRDAQGELRVGTIGCLAEREGAYYALTNRHVAGPDGGVVHALVRGQRQRIGTSDRNAVNRLRMTDVYPGWPGEHSIVNVDAGLIRLDDVRDWTSQVFGIGEIGEPFDATPSTLNLDIIGCPVRGFGGTSGVLEGEIMALFVRYKSLGGNDYVSDLLIGRRPSAVGDDPREPHPPDIACDPGDSGALLFYDPDPDAPVPVAAEGAVQPERGARARRLRPIAMLWGGQRIRWRDEADAEHTASYALATFVSTICRVLDVEIVRGYGVGHDEYWGKLAHFSIGYKACDLVGELDAPGLARLMKANQRNIGFDDATLSEGKAFRIGRGEFVPAVDVPDFRWTQRPHEDIQHFADIDIPDIDGGPPMLARCVADPRQIAASAWQAYFAGFADQGVGPDPGALPFRVWQLWDAMVDAVRAGNVLDFLVIAGVVGHYVGDGSQPLHCSWLHHGRPPTVEIDGRDYPVRHASDEYEAYSKSRAAKIHSIIDELVFEVEPEVALARASEALRDVPALVETLGLNQPITCGWEAAAAVVRLMAEAQRSLPPEDILAADHPDAGPTERARRLWACMGEQLPRLLALSTVLLTRLWHSAWVAGHGEQLPDEELTAFTEDAIQAVYSARDFLAALSLDQMVASGKFEPPTAQPTARRRRTVTGRPRRAGGRARAAGG